MANFLMLLSFIMITMVYVITQLPQSPEFCHSILSNKVGNYFKYAIYWQVVVRIVPAKPIIPWKLGRD